MRTDKQLQASRANGAKSRGPVTAAGKRNASQNSLQHGVFARALLLKGESVAEFEEFAQTLLDEFQPRTPFESTLVDNMIAARWRQTRLMIMQRAIMNREMARLEEMPLSNLGPIPAIGEDDGINATLAAEAFRNLAGESHTLGLMKGYELHFDRQYLRSHRRLVEVQDRRRTPPRTPAPVIPIRPEPVIDPTEESRERTQQAPENTTELKAARAFPEVFIRVHSSDGPLYGDLSGLVVANQSSEPRATPPSIAAVPA